MKTIPIIGLDFIDAYGTRHTSFQLCVRTTYSKAAAEAYAAKLNSEL